MTLPGFHAERALGRTTQRYVSNIAILSFSSQVSGSSQLQGGYVFTALGRGSCPAGLVCCGGRVDGEGFCMGDCCLRSSTCCGDSCANLQTDPDNCGKCNHTCPSGICRVGQCAGCPTGSSPCGGMCCPPGQCGSNGTCCHTDKGETGCLGHCCLPGQDCSGGMCCPSGQTGCSGTCRNLANDANNCGFCSNVCTGGMTCQGGTCACPSFLTDCGGTCVSLGSNSNCGACGHKCPAGMSCSSGTCVSLKSSCSPCSPNEGCTTKCCTTMTGECTGWFGPRRCIFFAGQQQCCVGGPFWGERPWIQACTVNSVAGGPPIPLFPSKGNDPC
jgi:hypothetical protein